MTNDGMLSQDEIDALLNGSGDESEEKKPSSENPPIDDYLSTMEQDALGEVGNISFGTSATTLSTLLNQKVEITTPETSMITKDNLINEFPQPHVGVEVTYTEGFKGVNVFVIKSSDAAIIADLMLGGDGTAPSEELSDIHLSAVQEAMNQMMGTAATSMSTVFTKKVDISPPSIAILDGEESEGAKNLHQEEIFVKVSFQLKIGTLIDSSIMQLLPVSFAKELVDQLMNPPQESTEAKEAVPESPKEQVQAYQNSPSPAAAQASYQTQQEPKHIGGHSMENTNVQAAEFSSFDQVELPAKEQRNLDMLLDIGLNVKVELGRTKRSVKDILELSTGSIIELDKLAGEPVDILVNDKLIAKGEVVVIEENFGVRVTDIVSQSDRLQNLK
ncbi:flagellar motor switch phosphatase FliY [Radiobacillus kanasensis]|uniref:flagellar motor switch phosphatase FliY n=1 Tax=Radiobacillus kanasensis TaxID=2844358 RepID=UPI001E3519A1|nr:flagellar motor switch phosphatase FliY [Radiobacillus kanasensis]UFU01034.1 flagellar motor switch phosphatase FliY [Radiobacillus kanasensis]